MKVEEQRSVVFKILLVVFCFVHLVPKPETYFENYVLGYNQFLIGGFVQVIICILLYKQIVKRSTLFIVMMVLLLMQIYNIVVNLT